MPAVALMAAGIIVFFAGVVIAVRAVRTMAISLEGRRKNVSKGHPWPTFGPGASFTIKSYREFSWNDPRPEKELRIGYRVVLLGVVTMIGAGLLAKFLRGSL